MKYTFVKLVDTRFENPMEYPWLFKVDSLDILLDYEETVQSSRMVKAFRDTVNSKEYDYATRKEDDHHMSQYDHTCNSLTYPLILRAQNKQTTLIETIEDLSNEVLHNKFDMLNRFGVIYIQPNGSYMTSSETHKIIETRELDNIIFPDNKKIRYLQWPNGIHWYAKIGDTDVVVNDKMKWDTRKDAEEAVKIFLNRSN